MTKPQNDFGHYRRCSRTGCATPRRGAFQLLMGSRQVELERQFGEAATYLAGSACGKNPLPSLDDSVRVALLPYHLLCRRDPSFLNNIPKATPFVSQPPDGPRYWQEFCVCRARLSRLHKLLTVLRGNCFWAHDKSAPTVLCCVTQVEASETAGLVKCLCESREHRMIDRRLFVKRTFLGGLVLYLDHWATSPAYSEDIIPPAPPIYVNEPAGTQPSPLRMPGLFPGRVVEIADPHAIVANRVSQPVIRRMLERALRELTGAPDVREAWSKFIEPKDIVGIKINPSGAPACCSSPEIVREIVAGVQSVGVPVQNIHVYDRYAYEIDVGSYQTLVPMGVRVIGVEERKLDASGYDSSIYCEANFFGEWETRSYMASIVSSSLTKIINVPTMKDHSAAGVTGCLKNIGYGTFNNVDRSHRRPFSFTDPLIGIMCSVEPLRSKAVLHIMDGMRMLWHGGPLNQNPKFIFPAGMLMVGTDPVAMDTIELEKIEAKRRKEGAPSVWSRDPKSLTDNGDEFYEDATKNLFYRQPHHIAAAGKLGLGTSDLKRIDHRVLGVG